MSGEANVYTEDWDFAKEGAAAAFLGRRAGAEILGLATYELQPGARRGELHLHYANEEMIVVLSGSPTLHTLEGSRELASGEVVACRRGRAGAHRLENASSDVARVLIFSTNLMPEIVEYPERGTIFAMTEQPGTTGVQDPESYGRVLRVFERKDGRPVPPDS